MQTHVDQITQDLRQKILFSAYSADQKLTETGLATDLGGSRTLVRIALGILEQEGLVVRTPNRGFRVRGFTLEDVTNAILVRGELEGMAARTAAEKGLDAEQAEAIRRTLDRMDAMLRDGFADPQNQMLWIEHNQTFHGQIVSASGNETLRNTIDQVSKLPLVSSRAIVFDQADPQKSLTSLCRAHDDHHRIFTAIQNRQGERAAACIREHARMSAQNKANSIDSMKQGLLGPQLPGIGLVAR